MSPAEELRAAARTLRETAAGATPGPWQADVSEIGDGTEWVAETLDIDDDAKTRANAAWIALTSPALAEPLAALLEGAADRYEWYLSEVSDQYRERIEPNARAASEYELAVARVIKLGGAS